LSSCKINKEDNSMTDEVPVTSSLTSYLNAVKHILET